MKIMDKAYKLLEKLLVLLATEREQIASDISTPAEATHAEFLILATIAMSKIKKIKKIEAMLDDVKSMF